jgi:organic hydroperoxide reductase OsmC/OhrA
MAVYEASVKWERLPGETFSDNRFHRGHDWLFDGGAKVSASASPHIVRAPLSDPAGVDPEEALVAATSSCHMLFFLSFAARKGFTIASYEDHATGEMTKGADGRQWLTRITLRPEIAFEGDKRPAAVDVEALHHAAHDACYIANSIKSEITVDGKAHGLL